MNGAFEGCVVHEAGTIRDALTAIDLGAAGIALATDGDGRLVGIATDGDLRRALLRGSELDAPLAPFLNREFIALHPSQARADALDFMRARRISAVPVVDEAGRPVALHLLHAFMHPVARGNWAVLMAGGLGMRLRPLTDDLPKPMLRVAGRPILERLVLHLVGHGISRIFISTGYRAEVIEQHFGDGERFGCRIEYLREDRPLGTGGALGLLPERPSEPILLLNGDLVTSVDLGRLLDFHAAGAFAATIGIYRYFHTVPFGSVERDGDRVIGLEEKPTLSREVNSGIYALAPEAVDLVERGRPTTMPAVVERLLADGARVGAFEIDEDWIDVGQREQLARAREGG